MTLRFDLTETENFEDHLQTHRIDVTNFKRQMEMIFTLSPSYLLTHNIEHINKSPFVGVLLDIHITGMHKLIEKYNKLHEAGIYNLTYTLNAYLSVIIESVYYWNGDVLKIYGDRCLNFWKVSAEQPLYEVLHVVIFCAHIIKSALADFDTKIPQKLNLELCIACGNVYPTCYGLRQRLLVLRGDPFEDLSQLRNVAKPGDILIAAKAWTHLISERYHVSRINEKTIKLLNINISHKASERVNNKILFAKKVEMEKLINQHIEFMHVRHNLRNTHSTDIMFKLTRNFVQTIPWRKSISEAIAFGNYEEICSFIDQRVQTHLADQQPIEYLTQMTTVTAQIIVIIPDLIACISDEFIAVIYNTVSKEFERTDNFIYMFEVTSDIRIIIVSGLEGTRMDMESKRSLKSGYRLNKSLQSMCGINSVSVGIFQPYIYCGVVGHPLRRDYVVLGSLLNKGFRILEKNKGKIICDYKTFKFSKLASFFFRCLRKGKCNMVFDTGQILEYDECIEEDPKTAVFEENAIFGRQKELDFIKEMFKYEELSQGLVLEGCTKIGKSALLKFIMNQATSLEKFDIVSLELTETTSAPFSAICHIYRQLYQIKSGLYEDIDSFLKLPTELINRHKSSYDGKQISKYNILHNIQNLLLFKTNQAVLIVIEDLQFIDEQSWEILKIIMEKFNIWLFGSADFSSGSSAIKKKLRTNILRIISLQRLSDYWINTIACNLLDLAAIEKYISKLIVSTCHGCPGYVQSCLLYFTDCEHHKLVYTRKEDINSEYIPIHSEIFNALTNPITVMTSKFNENLDNDTINDDKCTIDSITREFYFSLKPFEQNILRISSILGDLFTRELLMLILRPTSEEDFCKALDNIFREEIFECGSKYINGSPICDGKLVCRCYMTNEDMNKDENQYLARSRHVHCKLFHFKHKELKYTANSMIPNNQKKDIHLLCTDILENTINFCPVCLKDPINRFIVAPKYNEILQYCSGSDIHVTDCFANSAECIKSRIRRLLYNPCQCNKSVSCNYAIPLRPTFDPLRCNCLEILLFVFNNLIYHSNNSKHLGKQVFYHSIYGYLLVLSDSLSEGIAVLREAQELCMVNINSEKSEISPNFRRFILGRISMMMATALIKLRKYNQARSHMVIAFRQYNIPSVVFKYNHFQCLLKKSYLVNARGRYQVLIKPTWMRWEVGMGFIVCARIFFLKGHLAIARNCAKYSTWVLSQVNERIPMLFEAYCNVIDLYRFGLDREICEKLQKYVTKELLLNYCNDRGYYAKHLMALLIVDFEIKMCDAKLNEAVCMSYRIIHTTLKFYVYASVVDVFLWFSVLFAYTLRFKQFVDVMNVVNKNIGDHSNLWFYSNALDMTLLTAYSYLPVATLVKQISIILNYNSHARKSWDFHYLNSLVYLHMMKSEMYQQAESYKSLCVFNKNNLRRPIVMRSLLNLIEANLFEACYRMKNDLNYSRLRVTIDKYLDLGFICAKKMPIFLPRLHCLLAWKYKLNGYTKKANKELAKAEKISIAQKNLYFQCFVRRLRNHWDGNDLSAVTAYKSRYAVQLDATKFFHESQWVQVLLPYPI